MRIIYTIDGGTTLHMRARGTWDELGSFLDTLPKHFVVMSVFPDLLGMQDVPGEAMVNVDYSATARNQ